MIGFDTPAAAGQSWSSSIETGIVSGLITGLLILAFTTFWKRIFVPWLEDRLYKGTRIAGVWQTTIDDDGRSYNEQATLEQRGASITGTIHFPSDAEGRGHTYALDGEFRDRTLTLTHREIGESQQDFGAIVLDFIPGGSQPTMKGLGVWSDEGVIKAVAYTWVKMP